MRNYTVRLHHDAGFINITTNASDAETAVEIVLKLEHAPGSAVVWVKEAK